jgi:hypothetical protein
MKAIITAAVRRTAEEPVERCARRRFGSALATSPSCSSGLVEAS